jgi:uncharacterized membrane protein
LVVTVDMCTQTTPPARFVEQHRRSVIKAISWRITGTVDTMVVSLLITRSGRVAISIGVFEIFTKMCLYYLHERVWNRLRFGRIGAATMDYEI